MIAADVYINITYTIDEREGRETRQPRGSEQDPTPQGRRRKFTTVFYYNNPCNEDVSRLKVISFAVGFVGFVIAQKRPRGRRLFVVPQFVVVVVACPASRLGPPPV